MDIDNTGPSKTVGPTEEGITSTVVILVGLKPMGHPNAQAENQANGILQTTDDVGAGTRSGGGDIGAQPKPLAPVVLSSSVSVPVGPFRLLLNPLLSSLSWPQLVLQYPQHP